MSSEYLQRVPVEKVKSGRVIRVKREEAPVSRITLSTFLGLADIALSSTAIGGEILTNHTDNLVLNGMLLTVALIGIANILEDRLSPQK